MRFPRERLDRYRDGHGAVLGASGFNGRWVARGLTAAQAKPVLFVRDAGKANAIFREYRVHGEIIELDLTDEARTVALLRDLRPAITFNLAGYGVDPSERDEKCAREMNEQLVTTLCEVIAAFAHGCPNWAGQHLVHTGSALEYGVIRGDLSEDSEPRPTTLYGETKLAGTRSLARGCRALGISGLTARLFTVYGPGEHPGRLLPSLVEAARRGQPVSLTDGRQRRDFAYVEDVADGLLALGAGSAVPGEVINFASGTLLGVSQFVLEAAKVLGIPNSALKFGELPARAEEMWHSEVNVERLRQRLGWTPPTTVEPGIRKTKAFFDTVESTR
jgi:nucleoside-diphosphate-sugar epimerase